MLEILRIEHFVHLKACEVEFQTGLNIVSGETGAGKSVLLEALALLLGSRAQIDKIATGKPQAVVEGIFSIGTLPWMQERLKRFGFEGKEELWIKRILCRKGRHRIYINGELVTLAVLQKLCEGLVDLVGQSEHQSLLKGAYQLDLIDHYGNLTRQVDQYGKVFRYLQSLKKEHRWLLSEEGARNRKLDFLDFQIQELEKASLKEGEEKTLRERRDYLKSTKKRKELVEKCRILLEEGELLNQLKIFKQHFSELCVLEKSFQEEMEKFSDMRKQFETLSWKLSRYLESTSFSEVEWEQIEKRLAELATLRRKYGESVSEMLQNLMHFKQEKEALLCLQERKEIIEKKEKKTQEDLKKLGNIISEKRNKITQVFSELVTMEARELNMYKVDFKAEVHTEDCLDHWNVTGADRIQFLVKTHQGEPLKLLQKIASGGELSRFLLAIRRVISEHGKVAVYLFDEIDAGIGGKTAFVVGQKLKSVSENHQVIVITHLPQIACFADHHIVVEKKQKGEKVQATIEVIEEEKRFYELARMLGGQKVTKTSLLNAKDLIQMAQHGKWIQKKKKKKAKSKLSHLSLLS